MNMQQVERIDDILKRYEGQNVYVVIEVLSVDKRISKPLTGRLLGVTPDREEARRLARQVQFVMIRWVGEESEVIIVHANNSL
ncbi:MAG: hypothetical protein NZ805_08625 [Armatimonadetes bacterium]|nr:hypothetical protein [Armatimonadota bacterium]